MPGIRLLIPLVALSLLASCGKQQTTAARLRDDTAAVVVALNAKDVPSARRALDVLDLDLTAAGRLDQLDATQVTALRAGVTKVRADLALITLAPVVTVTTPPVTKAPPPTPRHHKGKGGGDH